MTIQLLDNVMSPEVGAQKGPAGPPPGMGAAPPGRGMPPPGQGGPPPSRGGPPQGFGAPPPPSSAMAKRLDTLDKKTVYLVDTGFGGSYQFMLQLQKWFKENMPSVTTIRKRKPGNVFMDDNNELWEEVKVKGNAVVLGVAG
ncbi:MAG: hypothetical protein ABR954_04325 [Dehalococcoidales bacterium]